MRTFAVGGLAVLVPALLLGFRLWTQWLVLQGPPGGSGTVEGDRVRLAARVSARLLTLEVAEGAAVTKGQRLASLDCAEPDAALAEAKARLAAAQAQAEAAAAQARVAGVAPSTAALSAEAARGQASALLAQRDAAQRQAGRVRRLDDGTTEAAVDQTATSAEALAAQSVAADASAKAARLQVDATREQAAAAAANADAAARAVEAAEAAVARAELLVGECVIVAPRDGVIETLPWEIGEIVPPGQPIATLVDLSSVEATFYLPNAELSQAKPGQKATIVADAWPDETFTATVSTVSAEAAFTPRNVQTRTDRDRLVYPVTVRADNADGKLRPGMPVQVTLVTP